MLLCLSTVEHRLLPVKTECKSWYKSLLSMFCPASCVLSICLNCQNKWGKMTLCLWMAKAEWNGSSCPHACYSAVAGGKVISTLIHGEVATTNFAVINRTSPQKGCLSNVYHEEKKAQNLVSELSSYYQVKGFWLSCRIIHFLTLHKLLSFSAGFRG